MARRKLNITVTPAGHVDAPPKRPRARWPWAVGGAAVMLATVAGASAWRLAHRTPQLPTAASRPSETPAEAVAEAASRAPDAPAAANRATSMPARASALASSDAPVRGEASRAAPRAGAVLIRGVTPSYAADFLTHAEKQLRVGTGSWRRVEALPLAIPAIAPGMTPIWFKANGFSVERAAETNPAVVWIAPGVTTDVTFTLAPRAAMLEIQARGAGEGEARRVHARHILLKAKPDESIAQKESRRVRAEGLRQKLTNGADFAALAREQSDCPSKGTGGDLGFFARGVMVPPFEEAAFRLAPGQVSEVVETVFGFHVLQVLEREGGGRLLSSNAFAVACTSPDGQRFTGNPIEVPSLQPLTVTVAAVGYRRKNLSLDPLAPETVERREVSLEREAGAIRVTVAVPDYAREYLGRTAKRLRLSTNEWLAVAALPHVLADLPCGPLDLAVDAEGFGLVTQRITVVDGQSADAAFALAPIPATLTVVCNVTGAVARVSGLAYSLSGSLSLPPLKPLELTIAATGYTARTVALAALEPGKAYRQEVQLEPAAAMMSPSATSGVEAGKPMAVDIGGGAKMEFVWIPAGDFLMGSSAAEQGTNENAGLNLPESPQQRIRITNGFWMGKFEVTQRQWAYLMGTNPAAFKASGGDAPVEQVSWSACQDFVQKLNALLRGGRFRLPTEAEWEYACRAGTTTRFSFGDSDADLHLYANYGDAANTWVNGNRDPARTDGSDRTARVGSLKPNPWGLYDMHGNVTEWCEDVPRVYGGGMMSGWKDLRINRGGSWNDTPNRCRSAARFKDWGTSGYANWYTGLRLVREEATAPVSAAPVDRPMTPEAGRPLAGTWRLTHGGQYWVTMAFTWDAGLCRASITEWGPSSWARFTVESVEIRGDDVVLALKMGAARPSVRLKLSSDRDRLEGSVSGDGYTKVIPVVGQLVSR